MNKFLSANKRKIIWIVAGIFAILLVTLLVINLYQYYSLYPTIGDEPPSAVLQIQGIEQRAQLWKYFWKWGNNYPDDFVPDDFIAYTSSKALVTTSPFSATLKFTANPQPRMFIFTADEPPQAVSIEVVDTAALDKPEEFKFDDQSYFTWNGRDFANNVILTKDLDVKNEQIFTLELKHGLYIITVSTNWVKGWAYYNFLVEVK